MGDDLTPNERLFLEHCPEYADKLLRPKNRAMLTKLAENFAAQPSKEIQALLFAQKYVESFHGLNLVPEYPPL